MKSIVLESKLDNVSLSRNMITCIATKYNPTLSVLNELKTIISEAFTNSIIHGYEGKDNKLIKIDVEDDINGINITITDEGVGIKDIDLALIPMYTTKKENERSGLGFTIIDIFSDEFKLESEIGKGTKIKVYKKW